MTELDDAITAAETRGDLGTAAALRKVRDEAAKSEVVTGEHAGRRWSATMVQASPAQVYPHNQNYRWRGQPAVVIEFGDAGELALVDPWSLAEFRLERAFDPDGQTPFVDGIRRLFDAAEDADWFYGRAQAGRAGVVRE